MYCSKCGTKNADETRFCRACGVELNALPSVLSTRSRESLALAEKAIELSSRGVLGLLFGIGLFIISAIVFSIPPRDGIFFLLPLAFSFFFLSASASRFVQAKRLRALSTMKEPEESATPKPELTSPARSIVAAGEPAAAPLSVTEHTTTQLKIHADRKIDLP